LLLFLNIFFKVLKVPTPQFLSQKPKKTHVAAKKTTTFHIVRRVRARGILEIYWRSPGELVLHSHSQVNEGVTVGSCRINRLLFSDNVVLLASSEQGLQHAFDRFSDVCDRPGMKVSIKLPKYYVSLQIQGSLCYQWAAVPCNRWRSSST